MTNPARILAVIVLYKVTIQECVTLKTLLGSQQNASSRNLQVLLFDNTPDAQPPSNLPDNVRYHAAGRNSGLAIAYNHALEVAKREGIDWLITLDHDSHLPRNYLSRMAELAQTFVGDSSVAGAVPQLSDHGRPLSPAFPGLLKAYPIPTGFVGFSPREIHAINSGAMLRVSTIVDLGGFNRLFWLDFLDWWLYAHFSKLGKRVFIAGDLHIEHELSVLDITNRLNCPRYENYLRAESAYTDLYRDHAAASALNLRLVVRWLLNWRRGVDISLQRVLLHCLNDRLFRSRKSRISEWTRDMERLNERLYTSSGC